MKNLLQTKSFQILAVALLLFFLVFSTKSIAARDETWNLLRAGLSFCSGLIVVFALTWIIYKKIVSQFGFVIKSLSAVAGIPLFLLGFFMVSTLSMCSYTKPLSGFSDQRQANVRNTRVFIDYVGDQGAPGYAGIGVYQEAPFLGSDKFMKTHLICESASKEGFIDFAVVDDHNIKCIYENDVKNYVKLPM